MNVRCCLIHLLEAQSIKLANQYIIDYSVKEKSYEYFHKFQTEIYGWFLVAKSNKINIHTQENIYTFNKNMCMQQSKFHLSIRQKYTWSIKSIWRSRKYMEARS